MRRDFDFSRWGIVSYADDTGLGRMAQDARSVLGIETQLVFPSQRMQSRAAGPGEIPLTKESSDAEIESTLGSMDGILLLERPDWHPRMLSIARRLDVATAAVVMWEWFRAADPAWREVDLLVCPNRKALEVVRSAGFRNAVLLPWAVALDRLPLRRISGPARVFMHNGGLMDQDDRKGTRDVIAAFKRVKDRSARLIVRLQARTPLPELDDRIEVRFGNVSTPGELYHEGDAAIQPSKLEGIGFMVLEPVCCGIPTITQNIQPLNEYAPGATLLTQPRWLKRKAFSSAWVPQSHLRLPRVDELACKISWCLENNLSELSRRSRAWAEEILNPAALRRAWTETFERSLSQTDSVPDLALL